MLEDTKYFHLARSVSYLSTHKQFKVGAVIVNKKPIAVGANLTKTHPIFANTKDGTYSIHAEMKAILSCPKSKLPGAELWVYREKADGSLGMAKPCDKCLSVLIEVGIKRIYYTTDSGYEIINL